jgi:hypothetical protein
MFGSISGETRNGLPKTQMNLILKELEENEESWREREREVKWQGPCA